MRPRPRRCSRDADEKRPVNPLVEVATVPVSKDGAQVEQSRVRRLIPLNRVQLHATALYTFFGVLPVISQFVLFPINTRFLAPSEFGVATLANVCRGYVTVLLLFGFDAALRRMYFDYYQKPEALRSLLATVFSSLLIASAICLAVGAVAGDFLFSTFFGDALPFSTYGWLTLGAAAVQVFVAVLLQFYRMSEDVRQYARLALFSFVLPTAGAVIGIVILRLGAFGSVAGRCLGQILIAWPVFLVVFRRFGLSWDSRGVKEMLRYGVPVTVCAMLSQSTLVFDKMMTAATFGLSDLGVYTAASVIAYTMVFVIDGLWNAVSPDVFRLLTERPREMTARLEKYAEMMLLLAFTCFIGLLATISPILQLLVARSYHAAAYYVPLLGCAYLWRTLYLLSAWNIYYYKRTRFLPLVYGGSLAAMGAFFAVVGRHMGMVGVCLAVVVGEFAQFVIAYWCAGPQRERYFFTASRRRVVALFSVVTAVEAANYAVLYRYVAAQGLLNLVEATAIAIVAGVLYRTQLSKIWQAGSSQLRGIYVVSGNS